MDALRRLHQVIVRVSSGGSLVDTLQAVIEGVLDAVGFEVAVVSLRGGDGMFETLAVGGPSDARDELLGRRMPADAYDAELAIAERWGELHFVPHERLPAGDPVGWVPTFDAVDHPDAWHPLDALFTQLRSPSGEVVGMLSVDLPLDRRKPNAFQRELLEMFATQAGVAINNARLTEQLRESEEVFRQAFEGAGSGVAVVSMDRHDAGRYLRVNPAFCRLVGRREGDLLQLRVADITHPDHRAADELAMREVLEGRADREPYRSEKRYLLPSGDSIWVAATSSTVFAEDGRPLSSITQIEDISGRRAAEAELARRADNDVLTGLPNRRTLRRRLVQVIETDRRAGNEGAVLFCDIDGFKIVNDSLGHGVGDRALLAVAGRLLAAARDTDMVARLGGDEFVVVAEGLSAAQAGELAGRLRAVAAEPIGIEGLDLPVTTTLSIGIATIDAGTSDPDMLLHRADDAMYEAKLAGRDAHAYAPPAAQS